MSQLEARSGGEDHDGGPDKKRKRTKRGMGKACVYCRRSHMVCEGGRPCERCIKRDISHLCRDFSPPRRQSTPADGLSHAGPSTTSHADPSSSSSAGPSVLVGSNFSLDSMNNPTTQLQRSYSGSLTSIDPSQLNANVPLYSDPNFAPAWPLLPDAQGGMGLGEGPDGWVGDDQTELGALSKYLGDLGVPNLPGGFLDVLTYFTKGGSNGSVPAAGVTETGMGMGQRSGNASGTQTPQISGMDGTSFADLTGGNEGLNGHGLGSGDGGNGEGSALGGAVFPPMMDTKPDISVNLAGVGAGSSGSVTIGAGVAQAGPSGTSGLNGARGQNGAGMMGAQTGVAPAAMTRDGSSGTGTGTGARASGATTAKGKGKEVVPLGNLSRIERYFLAAADQPSGPRSSRLSQVIKAKYDAGLLRPYDYVKGYERMKEWMDSGRAAPRVESAAPSAPGSPIKGPVSLGAGGGGGAGGAGSGSGGTGIHGLGGAGAGGAVKGLKPLTSTATPTGAGAGGAGGNTPGGAAAGTGIGTGTGNPNANISPDGRRRIWAAMNGFRPKFRQIARTLTEVDLVFIEEAMERWMLQYDRAFASIHTPSCIWRRTGEIQKANQEFANLTGIPASMFRNGQLCVYELMDEASAVRYWEGYAKIAFDAGQRSLYISCTLRIPTSLTRLPPRVPYATPTLLAAPKTAASGPSIPDLNLPQSLVQAANGNTAPVGTGSGTPQPPVSLSSAVPVSSHGEATTSKQLNGTAAATATVAGPGPATGGGTAGDTTPTSNPVPPPIPAGSRSRLSTVQAQAQAQAKEKYREIKCCFSVTIRRDAWGVPVAIMGQWIVR